jgi:hypothetical protein
VHVSDRKREKLSSRNFGIGLGFSDSQPIPITVIGGHRHFLAGSRLAFPNPPRIPGIVPIAIKPYPPVARSVRLDIFQRNSSNGGYGRNQLNVY